MSHKISPILRCEHPKTIYKDGKPMMVACGKCKTCLLRKSNTATTILRIFGEDYKYSHFITLTFAPEFLPTYTVTKYTLSDGETTLALVNSDERSKHRGEFVTLDFNDEDLPEVLNTIELGDKIGYVSKEDFQKFMKRLRINLKRHTSYDEKEIKYYAVSEYGPKHYRPHFHIQLYHNEPWYTPDIYEVIRESWPYGRVDVQLSRGHSAEYCVSYLNSYIELPRLYQIRALRPWSVHSIGLLKNTTTKQLCKEVYENEYRGDLQYTYEKDGRMETGNYPLQVATVIFPRLPYHRQLSRRTKCAVYRLVSQLPKRQDERSVYQKCKDITEYYYGRFIRHEVDSNPTFDRILSILAELPSWQNNILKWNTAELNPLIEGLQPFCSMWMFIYGIMRISNIALSICDECHISVESLVTQMDEFYDAKELRQLSDYYLTIQDLPIENQSIYFTDTLFLLDNELVKEYLSRLQVESYVKVKQRIKHKVINDIHNLLT